MKFSDQFRTGWRNIGRQKLRTTLTVFAIVIGSLAVTIMLALTTSATAFVSSVFERTGLKDRVFVTAEKQVDFYSAGRGYASGSARLTDADAEAVAKVDGVVAVARLAPTPFARVRGSDREVRDIPIVSYEANAASAHSMVAGRNFAADDGEGLVLISTKLAQKLGFDGEAAYTRLIGQKLTLEIGRAHV